MNRPFLTPLLASLSFSLLCGCGNDAPESPPPTAQAEDQADQATTARQQALVDEAITLIGRVADAAISIEDLNTANSACAIIDQIGVEFQALTAKMEQAGDPGPALVAKFRKQHEQASNDMAERIAESMRGKPKQTEAVAALFNQSFIRLGAILGHRAFQAYGIDGK